MFRLLHVYPFFDRVPSRACDDEIIPVGCSHFMAVSNIDLVLDAVQVRMPNETELSFNSRRDDGSHVFVIVYYACHTPE